MMNQKQMALIEKVRNHIDTAGYDEDEKRRHHEFLDTIIAMAGEFLDDAPSETASFAGVLSESATRMISTAPTMLDE